jgi:hypothetical protein
LAHHRVEAAICEGQCLRCYDLPEIASHAPKGFLRRGTRAQLLTLQQNSQNELKRYEEALRIATTVFAERDDQTGRQVAPLDF